MKMILMDAESQPKELISIIPEEVLHEDQGLLRKFDTYCKRVISNERKKVDRAVSTRKKYEAMYVQNQVQSWNTDVYASDELVVCAGKWRIVVTTEALQLALCALPVKHREAIILRFWQEWDDMRIAEYIGIVPRTVRKWRKVSMEQLRCHLERSYVVATDKRDNKGGHKRSSPGYRPGA